MSAPYRSELESLEARKRMLEGELSSVQSRIDERRRLPMLDQVRVASPCPAKWDEMVGDERKRFCLSCDKNVFNISALSREDAEQFLVANAGTEVCVRYYQRADGTIMTSDCSVGVKRKQRKKLALSVAGAGALVAASVAAVLHRESQVMGKMEMAGAVMVPYPPPTPTTTEIGPPDPGAWIAGSATPPPPVAPEGQWANGGIKAPDVVVQPRTPVRPAPRRVHQEP